MAMAGVPLVVMTEWAWAYLTLQRRVRLITGDPPGSHAL